MARIKRGILGGFVGSVANVVGSSWKGIDVMRSKPLSVANPRTAAQVAQRDKMAMMVVISKMLLVSIIKPLWDRFAQQQSGYNAFVSRNIGNVDGENFLNPANFIISEGTLTPASGMDAVGGLGTTDVTVTWNDNSGTGTAMANDKAYVVIEQNDNGKLKASGGLVDRSSGTVTIPVDAEITPGTAINAWLAFRRADGTLVSNSTFVFGSVA